MRLLVISSCTRDKRHNSPAELAEPDFLDPAHLARREQELRHHSCPAGEMYTGRQHLLVRQGLGLLRRAGVQADLAIVSAGYGLIPEDRVIAPYNVTFTGKTPATVRRRPTAWASRRRCAPPSGRTPWCSSFLATGT